MKKYRKKPVEIDAVELSLSTMGALMTQMKEEGHTSAVYSNPPARAVTGLAIHTLEGIMIANMGDYVIRGIQGEYYPCKPEIFLASYEEVISDNPSNKSEQTYGFFLESIKDVTDAHLDAELRAGLEEIQPGCFNIEIIINRKQDFASITGVHNNAA